MNEQPNPIQIQKYLSGVDYPAQKKDLLRNARESGADTAVVDALDALPDRTYDAPTDVSHELGDS